jgi:hypothetical protein
MLKHSQVAYYGGFILNKIKKTMEKKNKQLIKKLIVLIFIILFVLFYITITITSILNYNNIKEFCFQNGYTGYLLAGDIREINYCTIKRDSTLILIPIRNCNPNELEPYKLCFYN